MTSNSRLIARSRLLLFLFAALFAGGAAADTSAEKEEWIALFNGRDLDGLDTEDHRPRARRQLRQHIPCRRRAAQGALRPVQVFGKKFGHLFYKDPFSYYRLVVEYRFVGEQAPHGPGDWALRNSGAMLHSPHPRTMGRDQDFPISIEVQFLGGLGDGKARSTMNLCTPGTEVVYEGSIYPEHCLKSASKTFDGDQWVRAEILVLGSGQITHFVNGEEVLEYALPQFGGGAVSDFDPAAKPDGKLIEGGYISLQSESHPIDFRKVELLNLAGCMDRSASNYKRYYVKSVPESCVYAKGSKPEK